MPAHAWRQSFHVSRMVWRDGKGSLLPFQHWVCDGCGSNETIPVGHPPDPGDGECEQIQEIRKVVDS